MAKRSIIALLFLVAVLAATAVHWTFSQHSKRFPPEEKETMEFLSGYSFLFEGSRIEIKRKWTYQSFLSQHRMMPFLEKIAPRLKSYGWTKDRPPIEISETESTVIVIVPVWPPPPEDATGWFGWDYTFKMIFDKRNGECIWARRGG